MPLPGGTTNFGEVEQFESLTEGVYEGHVEYIRFKDGSDRNKSDQLSVCLVSDEEATQGEKAWQNLYFTQKSLYRMAQFFTIFGIEEIDWDNGLSDEEPFDLLDPDLTGEPVRFSVTPDGTYNGRPSFETEVIEWLGGKPAPAAKPAAKAAKAAEPKAADSTEEGGEDPEPAKPARRSFSPAKAAASEAKPARRALR